LVIADSAHVVSPAARGHAAAKKGLGAYRWRHRHSLEAVDEDISVASLLQPEKFMRLAITALQPTSRARRKAKSKPRSRAARG
jgi:hypothetical protein